MVHHQAAASLGPSMCTLNNPAHGQRYEAFGNDVAWLSAACVMEDICIAIARVSNHLHIKPIRGLQGLSTRAAIGAVNEQRLESRDLGTGLSHNIRRSIAVLDAGRGDRHGQQQAQRVHQHVPFAAFDFLAAIEAGVTALRRIARGLRVQHCRTGLGMAPKALAPLLTQPVLHGLEGTLRRPAAE